MKSKVQKVFQISIILVIILLVSAFVKAEKGSENNLISINLRDVELETALIMLANTADKNLICDSSVKGKITVIFNDIPFENALNLITDSFNLDYSYQKQIIYISTREKMAARNQKFVSKSYKFNNLSSELAAEILRNNFEEIKIINLNSEGLIINCKEKNLKELEKIISQIDQPQKQIMIKARIEEISRTKIKELGINPNQLAELKIIKNDSGNIEKLKPGWPETLKALNEKGLSNILANPSLMTLDRKKAKLVIGDQIPVKLERIESDKTVSTISYIEAGIVLEFLPKIINQNQILLEIKPSVNSIGQILADGLPAVNSRSAETTVILEDGETLAIGGLIKKDELKTVKEIPILADLPLLGSLFSAAKNTDIETELIIFITPEIIESEVRMVQNKITESNNNEINKKINSQKEEIKGEKQNKNNREFKTLTEEELKEIIN
ncbi:type II secretion system protein GspD [Halanaerobium kushneri]|uniref:Type IV pilus assembly protein PilQ n=1 Tax=Halanaerobium kushneri TaxID=56779 RepID=A0A1N6Q4L1_9FIRM|nr:type II and III secretion system protein [Halanaerobium kushneri]SIQ11538.1 type IV pilus assembly protein PilQ [Halanaerobium kushneri]